VIRRPPFDPAALAVLTGAPRVEVLDVVGSVLDVAHERAAAGAPNGTLVLAEEQSAGRGRHGRAWHSPRGAGVWLAAVVRPREAPAGGALAIRAGLAVRAAAAEADPRLEVRLKWPNDIILLDRKAGGVLCEARWSGNTLGWIAIGVGLNVAGPVAEAVADRAVALDAVVPGLTRESLVAALAPRLAALADRPALLEPAERGAYLAAAWQEAGSAEAIVDLADDGALLVRDRRGGVRRRAEPA